MEIRTRSRKRIQQPGTAGLPVFRMYVRTLGCQRDDPGSRYILYSERESLSLSLCGILAEYFGICNYRLIVLQHFIGMQGKSKKLNVSFTQAIMQICEAAGGTNNQSHYIVPVAIYLWTIIVTIYPYTSSLIMQPAANCSQRNSSLFMRRHLDSEHVWFISTAYLQIQYRRLIYTHTVRVEQKNIWRVSKRENGGKNKEKKRQEYLYIRIFFNMMDGHCYTP